MVHRPEVFFAVHDSLDLDEVGIRLFGAENVLFIDLGGETGGVLEDGVGAVHEVEGGDLQVVVDLLDEGLDQDVAHPVLQVLVISHFEEALL